MASFIAKLSDKLIKGENIMSAETKTLAEDFNDYESMWKDSASWVTASGNKINSSNNTKNKYKEKLQKLIDYHITDTAAHDAKARGRWKPTANMNIKALDETADSAFLTFTETCYRGQAGIAEERMIDAFYDKQTKKFKILFFLNKKLIIRKEGAGFNDMMEELCFFFRSPKFGTPERQDLMEWVDKNGNKITASSKATTAKQHPLNWPYANRFEKIIEYHMRHTPGTKVLKKDIAKYVFQYEELKKNGVIIDIIAGIDNKDDYLIKVFQDRTSLLDTFKGTGYENFLTDLEKYMVLPNKQDPEYQNLLIESVLTEFVDKNGTNINLNGVSTAPTGKSAISKSTSTTSGDVYAWSVYVRGSTTYTKGDWLSAEYFNGQLEGAVFSTPELAEEYAWDHLKELEDEGELYDEDEEVELDAEYFTIETVAYPKADMNANVDLIEFLDNSGQKVVLNSNSAAPKAPTQKASATSNSTASPVKSTPTSQPPVKVTKPFKRNQVKNKFGCLIDNWKPEFNKLGLHIWDTCKKPADEKDSMVGPSILRIYFEMSNGEEWRLEVTNTGITLNKGLQVYVDWDYVISTYRNGTEVIISRGKTKDYNDFLDILLGLGIISDKKKCV